MSDALTTLYSNPHWLNFVSRVVPLFDRRPAGGRPTSSAPAGHNGRSPLATSPSRPVRPQRSVYLLICLLPFLGHSDRQHEIPGVRGQYTYLFMPTTHPQGHRQPTRDLQTWAFCSICLQVYPILLASRRIRGPDATYLSVIQALFATHHG